MKLRFAILALAAFALVAACAREEAATDDGSPAVQEDTYDLTGRIISRDPATNQLTVDHDEIPGYMAAMVMPYEVRGQSVADLPADGTEITATVHATGEAYWLTDVSPAAGAAPTDTTMTDTTATGTTDTAGTSTGM